MWVLARGAELHPTRSLGGPETIAVASSSVYSEYSGVISKSNAPVPPRAKQPITSRADGEVSVSSSPENSRRWRSILGKHEPPVHREPDQQLTINSIRIDSSPSARNLQCTSITNVIVPVSNALGKVRQRPPHFPWSRWTLALLRRTEIGRPLIIHP